MYAAVIDVRMTLQKHFVSILILREFTAIFVLGHFDGRLYFSLVILVISFPILFALSSY